MDRRPPWSALRHNRSHSCTLVHTHHPKSRPNLRTDTSEKPAAQSTLTHSHTTEFSPRNPLDVVEKRLLHLSRLPSPAKTLYTLTSPTPVSHIFRTNSSGCAAAQYNFPSDPDLISELCCSLFDLALKDLLAGVFVFVAPCPLLSLDPRQTHSPPAPPGPISPTVPYQQPSRSQELERRL